MTDRFCCTACWALLEDHELTVHGCPHCQAADDLVELDDAGIATLTETAHGAREAKDRKAAAGVLRELLMEVV